MFLWGAHVGWAERFGWLVRFVEGCLWVVVGCLLGGRALGLGPWFVRVGRKGVWRHDVEGRRNDALCHTGWRSGELTMTVSKINVVCDDCGHESSQ